jgi:fructokinase
MTARTVVVGEALIDIVRDPYGNVEEHVGGSPLNVAAGIARLGHPVDFATTIGSDPHGERIEQFLTERGVHLLRASHTGDPTSTALADLDETGAAAYTFDLHWNLPEVPLAADARHIHTGSIGAMLEPGGANVLRALRAIRDRGTVSYDPNVRPTIMGPVEQIRPRMEEIIGLSDVVKASSDDLDILYAGQSAAAVMERWGDLGAGLAVVTLGAHGVSFRVTSTGEVGALPTRALHVVDTVGAGDSFMAGLISGLLTAGLLGDPDARARLARATLDDVQPAIERGLACSGITVGHAGAYAPTSDEL